MRDPRYDILFQPQKIGPLTVINRIYQVPHYNGGGCRVPSAAAAIPGVKAEGGWGVLFTEQTEMHHTSEITPFIELRLWEDQDIPSIAKMATTMKNHGALAGIQLAYSGINGPNMYTKAVPLAPSALPIRTFTNDPVQARAMDKTDIKNLRRWFVNAARRNPMAGFDLICLYGAHGFGIFQHFLSRATNQRSDEYGGSLENRSRFAREVIADMRNAVGDSMALTLRVSLDETIGALGFSNAEVRDFIATNAELPDLWDLAMGTWEDCSGPSRFKQEAAQEQSVHGIRELSPRPVVGVRRFTSPDVMVRMITSRRLDFTGHARPSIADPFLPRKIDMGRIEDIRECIGCNICITGDMTQGMGRCTQNPTWMEEWRRDWHPEKLAAKGKSRTVLVIGSVPAGLEAALAAANRGYDVGVAKARDTLGGRVARERLLPGLSAWGRVADYRLYQLGQRANVQMYPALVLNAKDVLDFDFQHICVATGAKWRADGVARQHVTPRPADGAMPVFTPDDLMEGRMPFGRDVNYDDDHSYISGVLAELCALKGCNVRLITTSAFVPDWTTNTLEQAAIHRRLAAVGVRILLNTGLAAIHSGEVETNCSYIDARARLECDAGVVVGSRLSDDTLYHDLIARKADWAAAGIASVELIGDAAATAPIAWATFAGHRYARMLDCPDIGDTLPFRRAVIALSQD